SIIKYFPPYTRMTHPKGGLSLWVELPEHIDTVKLYSLAKKEKITFMPGPIFTTTNKFRNNLRLNCTRWSAETESAIKKLGELARISHVEE
ncbi:MAG: PLP-dependent aminotransferase family protein, partial [Spirochaetes bacterium]|nr:PLP-dependent aminotransferase family protein [Spirochaetota bacterium]